MGSNAPAPAHLINESTKTQSEVTHLDVGFEYWSHPAQLEPTGRKAGIKEVMNKSKLLRGCPTPLWPTLHASVHVSIHASKDHFALDHTTRKQESTASPGFIAVTWQPCLGFKVNMLKFILWPQQPWLVWFGRLAVPLLALYMSTNTSFLCHLPRKVVPAHPRPLSMAEHSKCFHNDTQWMCSASLRECCLCLTYTHPLALQSSREEHLSEQAEPCSDGTVPKQRVSWTWPKAMLDLVPCYHLCDISHRLK